MDRSQKTIWADRAAVVACASAAFFASLALRFGVRFRDQEPVAGYRRFGGDAFRSWDENPAALADIPQPLPQRCRVLYLGGYLVMPKVQQEELASVFAAVLDAEDYLRRRLDRCECGR